MLDQDDEREEVDIAEEEAAKSSSMPGEEADEIDKAEHRAEEKAEEEEEHEELSGEQP